MEMDQTFGRAAKMVREYFSKNLFDPVLYHQTTIETTWAPNKTPKMANKPYQELHTSERTIVPRTVILPVQQSAHRGDG